MTRASNPDDPVFYVYVLFRPWDGSPCYVGKGKGARWRHHGYSAGGHKNVHLANIFKKAARDLPAVKIRSRLTEADALAIEVAIIAAIGRGKSGPLVNLTDGGDGVRGKDFTPEYRGKLSEAGKRRYRDPAERRKQSDRQNRPETRAKKRAASLAQFESPEARTLRSAQQKERMKDPERRRVISEARKKTPMSEDARAKLSATIKGRPKSPETREKMRQAALARHANKPSARAAT